MSGKGSAIINFGAGNTNASVAVTGQAAILSNSFCEAWVDGTRQAGTTDHSADEHAMLACACEPTCQNIIPGTGFTIVVAPGQFLTGRFNLLWTWV
jgi:predicted heme/steroid binding protein